MLTAGVGKLFQLINIDSRCFNTVERGRGGGGGGGGGGANCFNMAVQQTRTDVEANL